MVCWWIPYVPLLAGERGIIWRLGVLVCGYRNRVELGVKGGELSFNERDDRMEATGGRFLRVRSRSEVVLAEIVQETRPWELRDFEKIVKFRSFHSNLSKLDISNL